MKQKVSGLEAHLGYWLRYVSNHVSHAFSMKLEALGVTVAEWVVLRELHDEDAVAPSAIARTAARPTSISGEASSTTGRSVHAGIVHSGTIRIPESNANGTGSTSIRH